MSDFRKIICNINAGQLGNSKYQQHVGGLDNAQWQAAIFLPIKSIKHIHICIAKAHLTVTNSLTLESRNARSFGLQLESLTDYSLFKASNCYIYIFIPSNHCFRVNFQKFYMFSDKICWYYCHF